ncbi:hypothetical protein F7O40_02705 [Vibrio cholerae]|nr:hypothetical protein [Vibrio cholerae]MBG8949532.1 hypothetical protein [Vibrio cholerae]MBG8953087.1 hypothetical protein [Vibrio cholerae]
MFSLIISIIAIALVAALALASIYYGGSAFQEGSADAEASTVVNQGQQIQGAVTLADVDEKWDDKKTIDSLVTDKFLKEVPAVRGKKWSIKDTDLDSVGVKYATVDVVSKKVCEKIESQADADHVEGETDLDTAVVAEQAFGCISTGLAGSEVYKAYYTL